VPKSRKRSTAGRSAARTRSAPAAAQRTVQRPVQRRPSVPAAPVVRPADTGVLPPDGATYPQILRGETYLWWRSLLGAIFGVSMFLLLTAVISQGLVTLIWATTAGNYSYASYYREAFAFERPVGMLAANLGIAVLIPISWVLMLGVHQVRPRWLSSVRPGIRWPYLLGCLAVAMVSLNGVLLLSTLITDKPLRFSPQHGFWGFFVVIVLTSPLQAMAEEIFFRGYLMQALGSLVAQPWFGVVVSALVFALLHGLQNLPLFVSRLAFGLLAGVLVWRTGGLEAGIAAHIVNNVCAYTIAGLTTSIATIKAVREISWVDSAFDVGGFALFAALAYGVFRLLRLSNRVQLVVPDQR
jgi:membrane protease YdiL (CAAX protease family)